MEHSRVREPGMVANEVYWWAEAPLSTIAEKPVDPTCDTVIVGAGYTGLSAAIALARAGRSVQVFDRQKPGEGASTRNGGIASGNIRPGRAELERSFGKERADGIEREARAARDDLAGFIADEKIDCDYRHVGRFAGASTAGDYDGLAREAERLAGSGIEAYEVPRAEQRNYLGTDYYHGGSVRMDIAGLHPAKFHAGMLRVALAAGVTVHGETPVLSFRREGDGYLVETARGPVRARDLIVGTNGYGDRFDTWLRRRIVPVRSRIVATAPLSPNLMATLMPRQMMCAETRRLHYYYRPSPDGTRILFGGRDGTIAGDPVWPIENLRRAMVDVFPELEGTEITHSWFGHVAMTRDMVPRIFSREGMRYAAGYCGSGVVWARWAGQKAALQVLGRQEGDSALDFRPPPAVPLFNGTAWFMPAVFAWLTARDRFDAWRGRG